MQKSKVTELIAEREALAKREEDLKNEVKDIFDAVDRTEKKGWKNLDSKTIKINNEKRQIGWNKMVEIKSIDSKLIELDSKIKSLKIQQEWEFVVCDSKLRGHIQMVVNDISRLNNNLDYPVINQELRDTLMKLKRIVSAIQKNG